MPDDPELNEAEVSDAMSDNEHDYDDDMEDKDMHAHASESNGDGDDTKMKYDPKDPSRPRRKKARRACFACQRAHLTCGDERPCQRCQKRGLAAQCQDGIRKKAKYLHDAPPEALGPVLGPNYTASPTSRANGQRQPSSAGSEASSAVGPFFPGSGAGNPFAAAVFPGQTAVAPLPESMAFAGQQQSPVSPSFQGPNSMTIPQVSGDMSGYSPAFLDPSNPAALFNFNPEVYNFGSQYGAMEFGMLGHMSSGAAETPPRDPSISQHSQAGASDVGFGPATGVLANSGMPYDNSGMIGDLFGMDQSSNGLYAQGNLQHGLPHAFAIAAGPTSLQSPSTENDSPQPTSYGLDTSPSAANSYSANTPLSNSQASANRTGGVAPQPPRSRPRPALLARPFPQSILGKRSNRADPSYIYDTVSEPYKYVHAFHRLTALVKERFSPSKTLRIAKALASIRPSFISCTRTLNQADLVFMEKCFQRTLFEYDDFMLQCSAPTIVCRRTGEVAAVNKEFTALTGWTKNVLLGKEPNLSVNTGGATASSAASTTAREGLIGPPTPTPGALTLSGGADEISAVADGSTTTAVAPADGEGNSADNAGRGLLPSRPVFIAELMDDDSVIDFYKDYAQLAFGDSRGHVTRKCRLLKYRTAEQQSGLDVTGAAASGDDAPGTPRKNNNSNHGSGAHKRSSILSSRVTRIDGEHGISRFSKDGKLECSYCWTIKRDPFDIPMMIVMNFLPCYYPDQEPHQLAV